MLSSSFKKTIKEILSSKYNLDCYKIIDHTRANSGYVTKIYQLHCKYNDYKLIVYLHLYGYFSDNLDDSVLGFKVFMDNTNFSSQRILASDLHSISFDESLKKIYSIFEKSVEPIEFDNYFLDNFCIFSGSYSFDGKKVNIVDIKSELFVKKVITFRGKKQIKLFSKFCICTFQDEKITFSIINGDIEQEIKIENEQIDQDLLTLTLWRMLLIDLSAKCSDVIEKEAIIDYDTAHLEKITTLLGMINI